MKILFVCLGNICRSPMAEAVMKHLVDKNGSQSEVEVDSAGTSSYHIGSSPDHRTIKVCKSNGVKVEHRARQLVDEDFQRFDYILCMDDSNLSNVKQHASNVANSKAQIQLLGSYDPQGQKIIVDPYYGDMSDFEVNFQQCLRSCENFMKQVELI
ncbi:hypothetical protein MIR68_005291 [Amoeboaphelidium protococcarum]|nr:hypothetical protein MIR68_005291 [Amoeboaphelidium protococcarum]